MYTPVVHGRIYIDRKTGAMKICCVANYFPIAFVLGLLVIVDVRNDPGFLVGASILLGVIYVIQVRRYVGALHYVAGEWSSDGTG